MDLHIVNLSLSAPLCESAYSFSAYAAARQNMSLVDGLSIMVISARMSNNSLLNREGNYEDIVGLRDVLRRN
jgi:hypothetical protein